MNIDSFYNELNKYKKQCLIINNVEINPIEIIVIVKNKRRLWRCLNKKKEHYDSERILVGKRVVRLYSFKELGIEKCVDNLKERGLKIQTNVYQLCLEDIVPILMVFISFSFFYDCFLKEHYKSIVHQFLADEGHDKMVYDSFYRESFHGEMKNRIRTVTVEKVRRKLALYWIKKEIVKEMSMRGNYINKLFYNHVITNKGKRIDITEGNSLSIFFEDIWNDDHIFLKGGGYSKYQSSINEIEAHKILSKCKEDWFLRVYDYDKENRWVAYPYIQETYLDKLIAKRHLSKKELRVLYEFLIESLDGLMKYGVLHNDFRLENIIAILDEKQVLSSCRLYDFGCAATRERYPWNGKGFVSKEIGMMVGGNYRYSSDYIDDAASAYLIYIHAGGDVQSSEAKELYSRIGRQFLYSNYGILNHKIFI